MLDLNKLKFTTEDDNEYIIVSYKLIDKSYYAYAVNINNEIDSMYVKILTNNDELLFEVINDKKIINELLKSINNKD